MPVDRLGLPLRLVLRGLLPLLRRLLPRLPRGLRVLALRHAVAVAAAVRVRGRLGVEPGERGSGPQEQPGALGREHGGNRGLVLDGERRLVRPGGVRRPRGQRRPDRSRRLYLEHPALLQDARALGLRRGVPAQQRGVLVAQPGQFGALGAQPLLQLRAQLAGLLEVGLQFGDPFLEAPLVARTRAREVGDALARLGVPAAQHDRADDRRRRGGRGQTAEHHRLREHPGPQGADEGDACDRRGGQQPVQGRGMAMTSTWHGQKLTARRRIVVTHPAKTKPHQGTHTASELGKKRNQPFMGRGTDYTDFRNNSQDHFPRPSRRSLIHSSVAGISRRQVLKLCPPLSRMIDEIRVSPVSFTRSMNFSVSL